MILQNVSPVRYIQGIYKIKDRSLNLFKRDEKRSVSEGGTK